MPAIKNKLLRGTLVLTAAGFLSRFMGFFFRIFLSRTFGEEGVGLYQLSFPVYSLCFSLSIAGIETALSRTTARALSRKEHDRADIALLSALLLTLLPSCVLALAVQKHSAFLASEVLGDPRCTQLLMIMACALPFSAFHSCLCGQSFGMQKSKLPALSQLIEQTVRITAVVALCFLLTREGQTPGIQIAAAGIVFGEFGAAVYSSRFLRINPSRRNPVSCKTKKNPAMQDSISEPNHASSVSRKAGFSRSLTCETTSTSRHTATSPRKAELFHSSTCETASTSRHAATRPRKTGKIRPFLRETVSLLRLGLPLTANRTAVTLLQSIEAVSIPACLKIYYSSQSEALSTYGVLTGMALPCILFPSAITGSLSAMLMPAVAERQAEGNGRNIIALVRKAVGSCFILGLACCLIFLLTGSFLGEHVFHSAAAGKFILTLAWICPFLYTNSALLSTINGLGHTFVTLLINSTGLAIRIAGIYLAIPRFGIRGYLWGMLVSQAAVSLIAVSALCVLNRGGQKNHLR